MCVCVCVRTEDKRGGREEEEAELDRKSKAKKQARFVSPKRMSKVHCFAVSCHRATTRQRDREGQRRGRLDDQAVSLTYVLSTCLYTSKYIYIYR